MAADSMRRTWVIVAVVATVLIVLIASTGLGRPSPGPTAAAPIGTTTPAPSAGEASSEPSPTGTAGAPPTAGALEPLGALLSLLRVAPEDRSGYDRSLFVHWIDADGDGCDTRREVLIAEAIAAPTVGPRCLLTGGRWISLYDGLSFTDAADLQIDHVVALAEAWDSGASAWTPARREAYANDLGEPWPLIAVSSASNQGKSDRDPADWLPTAAADECPFLSAWIATKARWNLAVDTRERDALVTEIADCPGSEMPYDPAPPSGQSGGPTPGPTSGATTEPGGQCDPAYPTVCIPPPPPDLDCGEITYRNFMVLPPDPHRFDGDRDGIGCET
jgi:hypothetical protein